MAGGDANETSDIDLLDLLVRLRPKTSGRTLAGPEMEVRKLLGPASARRDNPQDQFESYTQ